MTGLFSGVYGTPECDAATSSTAWLHAMLQVERALAVAGARVGMVPASAGEAIAAQCRVELFDIEALGRAAAVEATPVVALVEQLRALVPPEVGPSVHVAATSQDVLDTAMVLVARAAVQLALTDAGRVCAVLAELAHDHRQTVQVGRTLLQHGAVTTFGAACAARLVAIDDARTGLAAVARSGLALQLGGAVGTLGNAGVRAEIFLAAVAAELDLPEPVVPWHTARGRVASLAAACAILAGELAGSAQDLVLLSATEIGEVRLAAPGRSSAMPHKRNPSSAVLAVACAHRMPALAATVLAGMPQALQRSAGSWQAEWGTITDLLRLLAGTARHTLAALDGLHVDVDRMQAHVDHLVAEGVSGDTGAAALFVDRALAAHAAMAVDR